MPPTAVMAAAAAAAASLDLVDTEYSACSISVCPNDRSLVACGLYQVVKDGSKPANDDSPATKRLGRCLLSTLDRKGRFREVQRIEAAAILDQAWSYEGTVNRSAHADSVGQIVFHDLVEGRLKHRQTVSVGDEGTLCLSLDWDNRLSRTSGSVVVSVSDGSIAVVRDVQGTYEVDESWHAHDFEPWIAAWDYWNTSCIWTGGDDCRLKVWDLRQGTASPAAQNKSFSAGVTTIQSSPHEENIFAVGSYDAKVRIFDRRQIKDALIEHDVGGGVWRVRWHPRDRTKLLTACMHDGFKVLKLDTDGSCTTSTRFDAHGKDALAYGVDWSLPLAVSGDDVAGLQGGSESYAEAQDLVASCSFYDHQMRSWSTG